MESMNKIIASSLAFTKQKQFSNPFFKNTVLSIIGSGLNVILLGAYFVVLARALGPKEYGAFAAVLALSRIFSFFASWGYGNILIKNVSRDPSKFQAYWGICLLIILIGGLSLTLVVLAISKVMLHLSISVAAIVFISFSDLIFAGILALSQQAYLSFDNMLRYMQLQSGASAFRLAGAIFMMVTVREPSVLSWSILYLITGIIPSIFGLALVNKELGRYIFGMKIVKAEILEGFYFSVSQSSQTVYNDIDKTLLASMASLEVAGLYTAAYRFIDFTFTPINGLLISSYANFFRHGWDGVRGSLNWAKKIILWAGAYGLLAAIGLYFIAGLLPFFLGSAYNETAVILRWLAPIIIFKSVELLIANILTGSGHQGVRTSIQLILALVNFLVTIWLIQLYGWFGAVLASLGTEVLAVASFSIGVLVLLRKPKIGQI
jgi:O-antigen/teichoic acid export membrane protein